MLSNLSKTLSLKSARIGILVVFLLVVAVFLTIKLMPSVSLERLGNVLNQDFLIFLLIGVFAQLVDGTLGMGYGATSTSFLLACGVPPAVSSTSVHVSEMFTTGASAISHYKFNNINKKLFRYLLIPGVVGSAVGAYLLADIIDGKAIKPYIAMYMIVLAVIIIIKGLRKNQVKRKTKNLGILAVFGGFMDWEHYCGIFSK